MGGSTTKLGVVCVSGIYGGKVWFFSQGSGRSISSSTSLSSEWSCSWDDLADDSKIKVLLIGTFSHFLCFGFWRARSSLSTPPTFHAAYVFLLSGGNDGDSWVYEPSPSFGACIFNLCASFLFWWTVRIRFRPARL